MFIINRLEYSFFALWEEVIICHLLKDVFNLPEGYKINFVSNGLQSWLTIIIGPFHKHRVNVNLPTHFAVSFVLVSKFVIYKFK